MPRYIAFLRGVSPVNAKMPEIKKCFLAAGSKDVLTVLSSGNVVFSTGTSALPSLEKKAEKASRQDNSGKAGGAIEALARPGAGLG